MEILVLFMLVAVVAAIVKVGFWVLLFLGVARAVSAHQAAIDQSLESFNALLRQAARSPGPERGIPLSMQSG